MPKVSLIQNIVGGQAVSDVRLAGLAESINMYTEKSGETTILRSIHGTSLIAKVSDRKCRGLFEASKGVDGKPVLFGVFGTSLYVFTEDGPEEIYRQLTNVDTPVGMCETGGEGSAHPHLIVVDGSNVLAVTTDMTPADMMLDVKEIALPYRVDSTTQRIIPTHCAYVFNYLIVNDSGTDAFYCSKQYPFEDEDDDIFMIGPGGKYPDYGFVTYAEWAPDLLTALSVNNNLLITFGPKSSQIFTYNSDVDAPFVSPSNAANGIGIRAVYSLANVGNYLFFLGSSDIGENGIFYYEMNQLTRISTSDIERQISKMKCPEDAVGQCWTENGHAFYSITFIEDDLTLVYDLAEKEWHRRSTRDKNSNLHHYWRPMFARLHNNKLMFGTEDGCLVWLNPRKFDEYDARPIIRVRRSGMVLSNYNDYYVDRVRLFCNTGDFDNVNLVPKIMMRYCDHGGAWANEEMGMLGNQGHYNWEVEWFNLGIHNVMTLEFSCSDPVNFAIIAAKIQHEEVDAF